MRRRYDFKCPACGVFEAEGRVDERQVECACGLTATRLPFSGAPYLKGDTVPTRQIPDVAYKEEAQMKELHSTWGTVERTYELLHNNVVVDGEGNKSIDLAGMRRDS